MSLFGNDYHCNYCSCPIGLWKPMDTYQSDRCCEFYDGLYSIAGDIEERDGYISYNSLMWECRYLKAQYTDIPNFEAAIRECFDVFDDVGVFKTKPDNVYNMQLLLKKE